MPRDPSRGRSPCRRSLQRDSLAKILIIDDNRAFVDFVVRVFAQQGMTVDVAGTFGEAVAMAAERSPERVISELKVKDQYLFEQMDALAETIPSGKLVVVTAYPSIATAVQFMRMGVAAYVTKPLSAPMLAGTVPLAITGTQRGRPRVQVTDLADVGPHDLGIHLARSRHCRIDIRGGPKIGPRSAFAAADAGEVCPSASADRYEAANAAECFPIVRTGTK